MRPYGSALALALMMAMATPATTDAKSDSPDYTYVLLGAQGPIARAIYSEATECPSINVDGKDQPMNARTGDKTAFPVLVCERLVADAKKVELDGKKLKLPPGKLESVAVIGDTGCRIGADADDDDSGDSSDCDEKSWPFSAVAANAAKRRPQIVVHVGDSSTVRSRPGGTPGTPG